MSQIPESSFLSMNRPTPTPPRRGSLPGPLLRGVGVGSESPCAREVRGGLSPCEERAGSGPRRAEIPANRPPLPVPPSDGREGEVLARPHSEMRPRRSWSNQAACLSHWLQYPSATVKRTWNMAMPIALMIVFALTRWPGLMPPNFSAAYALAFCAGVYFPRRLAWWLPLATLAVTDLIINSYYYFAQGINAFQLYQLVNYGVYAIIIWLGQRFNDRSSWLSLLSGGLLGSVLFYFITNTTAWLFNPFNNPEYTKDFAGWLIALTKGTAGWPQTWEFFRNTLFSGGLFTGLFAGAMKLSEAAEPCEDTDEEAETDEASPEESKA